MEIIDLKTLKIEANKEIDNTADLKSLDDIDKKYLGKKGELTRILRSLQILPKEKRANMGKAANEVKNVLKQKIEIKRKEIGKDVIIADKERIDATRPGKAPIQGHLHILTQTRREVEEIFRSMGFEVAEGPEVENEWYNFDALNIPKNHPARDVWDTFWLKSAKERLLLRTHTSPVQIHYMETHKPPLRIIVPGNVFRHEATDQRHEFQLFQVEGLMVDKDISVPNFKAIVGEFFRRFFNKNMGFRLRPDFFPFTEPSFDIGMTCLICEGKGCQLCKGSGFLEVAGAGMVHPNVFKASGVDPKKWKGWAFGFGLDRLAMMKYKINDVRLFRSGDMRFLNQF
ncbi:MAG: phenylalanine--tRNA ligase subunit alpha [Candidatus Parcubacteria bacterium]|nr:phenylalanine--tRNA ligase subunit alpha [Candidatus Parcubacteria bacterium]